MKSFFGVLLLIFGLILLIGESEDLKTLVLIKLVGFVAMLVSLFLFKQVEKNKNNKNN